MISEFKVPLVCELRALGVELFSFGLHNETSNGDWVEWATVNGVQLEGPEARAAVGVLLANVEFFKHGHTSMPAGKTCRHCGHDSGAHVLLLGTEDDRDDHPCWYGIAEPDECECCPGFEC